MPPGCLCVLAVWELAGVLIPRGTPTLTAESPLHGASHSLVGQGAWAEGWQVKSQEARQPEPGTGPLGIEKDLGLVFLPQVLV